MQKAEAEITQIPWIFAKSGDQIVCEMGKVLFWEGEPATTRYLIVCGVVQGFKKQKGKITGLFIGGTNKVIGMHGLICPSYIYSARCITTVKALALQLAVAREALHQTSQQNMEVISLVMAEAETVESWVTEMVSVKTEERILKVLRQLYESPSKEKFLTYGIDETLMAELVGSSPAYIRRRVFAMQQQGLLRYSRGRLYYTSKLISLFAHND